MSWVNFGSKVTSSPSTFNQPVGGSSLAKGFHEDVTIIGIEPGINNEYPSMMITWEKEGETKKDSIFFLDFKKEGYSSSYINLSVALVKDPVLRTQFFDDLAPNKGELFNSLTGMKANLRIGLKKVKTLGSKYKIKNLGENQYTIVDAFDDSTIPDGIDPVFDSYETAKAEAEEKLLSLTYMNVLRITPSKDLELREAQDERLRAIVKTATGPAKPKAAVSF